jgi:hypothetical protein
MRVASDSRDSYVARSRNRLDARATVPGEGGRIRRGSTRAGYPHKLAVADGRIADMRFAEKIDANDPERKSSEGLRGI